ncbi:hypothetical protein [Pedobacter sp. GR22-6]|uniref:hypothetical protein n=1 Tax=Pedobacter sp. GR22-6 TaxID=3127957 RepID=UPI00307E5195
MKAFLKSPVLHGVLVANFSILAIIGLHKYLLGNSSKESILIFSEFVVLPILMGVIAAWFWRDLGLSGKRTVKYACFNSLFAILMSAIFLGEGMICLLIVSPLIFAFSITGTFMGQRMFKKKNQGLNVSIISMLFVVFVVDAVSEHDYQNMVGDEMLIRARPEQVWKHVVAFEKIKQKNDYWLFQIGMPSPMQTTVDGYCKGAGRKCIFSNGYIFDEKIVTYEQNKDLTFDIVAQPLDPEIMGHIDILRGQFLLKDNLDGTTTLIGNSWYKLHVFPVWYYDLWAESITRNVHLRVMDHIKMLSENN